MSAEQRPVGPVITVRGAHRATAQPEIGRLSLQAEASGPERAATVARATELAATARERLTALHHETAGPVIEWSSQAVQVWSERPWNEQGKQLPLVHHARIELRADFIDFEALAQLVESLAAIEGIAVQGVGWRLQEASRLALLAEVQRAAVADAIAKARNYAEALGLGSVTALALADPGLLSDGDVSQPQARSKAMFAMADAMPAPEGGMELRPEELAFTVEVEGRFLAS